MKAYISISYSKRQTLNKELDTIIGVLNKFKIEPFVFVDNYKFDLAHERQMMKLATSNIDNSDLLIAETTDKGIGIGIEVGYAKAKNKPVIYVRQKKAEHSTTVSGISDFQIIYEDTEDLKNQLTVTIPEIVKVINLK
jgi:nucleoside 2-deoxyribosyltransferase